MILWMFNPSIVHHRESPDSPCNRLRRRWMMSKAARWGNFCTTSTWVCPDFWANISTIYWSIWWGKSSIYWGYFVGIDWSLDVFWSLVGQHCDPHLMSFTEHLLGVFHGIILYQPFIGVLKGNMSSKFCDFLIRQSESHLMNFSQNNNEKLNWRGGQKEIDHN